MRLAGAELAAFAAGCLLLGTTFILCAAPAAYAALQELKPSVEPPVAELRNLVGKDATVTFTVMAVGGRANLYLNSQQDWRRADCFTAMLVPATRDELKKLGVQAPYTDLIGRNVRCQGEVELNEGRVRIVVHDVAKQLEILVPGAAADDADTEKPGAMSTGEEAAAAESTAAEAPAEGAPTAETPAAESPAAAISPPSSPDTPYVHPSVEELRASVGKEAVVTFRVLNAGGRSHLYINSQQNFRRSDCFTAQVEPAAMSGLATLGLDNPRSELIGKLLECRGQLRLNEGRLSISVTDAEKQLQIVKEPAVEPNPAEEPQPVAEPPAAP